MSDKTPTSNPMHQTSVVHWSFQSPADCAK